MNKETVLFIDGENFMFAAARILKSRGLIQHKSEIKNISIKSIIESALKEYHISKTNFYAGKIHIPKNVPELIPKLHLIAESQRKLKRCLTNEGIEYIMAGHVRLQATKQDVNGKLQGVFKEKEQMFGLR